jgi:phospholipase C
MVSPLPAAASGVAGPVGLGFRVPCILMSPFTRGGYLSSDTFDHTSTLRFIETRFGVTVPNLSAWRRSAVGDLTSALALGKPAVDAKPSLPPAPLLNLQVDEEVIANALLGTFDGGIPYPPPKSNLMPTQATTPVRSAPPH